MKTFIHMCHFSRFKKAFDTVDHCIIMKKLYHFGIRGSAQNFSQAIYKID